MGWDRLAQALTHCGINATLLAALQTQLGPFNDRIANLNQQLSWAIECASTGLLLLDCLMIFEPFGLLAILPFPDWLRQFLPAYKATRIIAGQK